MKLAFSISLLAALAVEQSSAFSIPNHTPNTLAFNHDHQFQINKASTSTSTYTTSTTTLFMADENNKNNNDDEDDEPLTDELSKLIGKRASLTKKTSSTEGPTVSQIINEEYVDPKTASLYEGKSGMDMFEMPDFSSARPLRTPKEADDKARGGSGTGEDDDNAGFYVDFQAEYDDENDLHIPNRIGFTTKAWGDRSLGFKGGKKLKKKDIKRGKFLAGDLQVAFDKLTDAGIIFCDTSENYGLGSRPKNRSAEEILCQCMDTNVDAQPIMTSTLSNPWRSLKQGTGLRIGRSSVLKAIEGSAERLGTSAIDIYQVPANMFYIGAPGAVASSICAAMDQGLINNIGVKNMYSKTKLNSFNNKMNKMGEYSITSNQFEFSLVNRKAHKNGLINACKNLGIIPVAANPLGDGLASGVWTAADPTGGQVAVKQPFDFKTLEKYSTLHDMLNTVQIKVQKRMEKENTKLKDRRDKYGGPPINTDVSTTQIALNYIVAKGCVPMPSVNNPKDADEIIGCLGWALTDEEVKMLDNAADMSDKGKVV